MRLVTLLLFSVILTGCGGLSLVAEAPEATLADLEPVALADTEPELPQVPLDQLADIYREVLQVSHDPTTRLLVEHRLADIEMLDGEASLAAAEAESDHGYFSGAIEAYEALLRDNPDSPVNDQLLYQLSKAYDFSGDNTSSLAVLERLSEDYPGSVHFLEAEFRKAESYFSASDYAAAELAYGKVIEYGEDSPYYTNALYMQGWSRFKQGHYRQSVAAFTGTLDQLMPANNALDALQRGEAELVQDCFRVLAVVFSYLEGAEAIAIAYDQLGERPYQYLLYQALGDLYLGQERYRDSAETYKAYTREFPDSKVAHQMQLRVIESYHAGGFAKLIVQEKQHYVAVFGVAGSYWLRSDDDARAAMAGQLRLFIGELASYYHAMAQETAERGKQPGLAREHYLSAADYYQLYIDSFAQDARVADMGFLLAESRFEAGDYLRAIHDYEWVAYQFIDYERAADAGYSAILSWQRILEVAGAADSGELQRERINSELRFATVFADDKRAPSVLSHAASALMELEQYQQAILAAATLARWQPAIDDELLLSALLVMGHSHFELQQYLDAEQSYGQSLELMPDLDERRDGIVDRRAASIYRQAEQAVASAEYAQAATQFARVVAVAPQSQISVNAHFDAASNYLRAGDVEQGNRLLIEFRQRYPGHELSASIAPTLVANYEQLGQWNEAAAELDTIFASEPAGDGKRQALYLAAEYYDKADNRERAIERFRSYAHAWPEPVAVRLEAINRLAQLYQLSGQEQQRLFWLKELVAAHERAGPQQSERSLYLAALSSSVLAEEQYRAYSAIKLRFPLKQSLRDKKAAMQRTLAAYQQTNEYAVQQFSTLAAYRMARVYQLLSTELMASERPADIDELALEQYELMLEEQAYPFEEKAIAIHEANARRSWDGVYDEWVQDSFVALAELLPARYLKTESSISISRDIY